MELNASDSDERFNPGSIDPSENAKDQSSLNDDVITHENNGDQLSSLKNELQRDLSTEYEGMWSSANIATTEVIVPPLFGGSGRGNASENVAEGSEDESSSKITSLQAAVAESTSKKPSTVEMLGLLTSAGCEVSQSTFTVERIEAKLLDPICVLQRGDIHPIDFAVPTKADYEAMSSSSSSSNNAIVELTPIEGEDSKISSTTSSVSEEHLPNFDEAAAGPAEVKKTNLITLPHGEGIRTLAGVSITETDDKAMPTLIPLSLSKRKLPIIEEAGVEYIENRASSLIYGSNSVNITQQEPVMKEEVGETTAEVFSLAVHPESEILVKQETIRKGRTIETILHKGCMQTFDHSSPWEVKEREGLAEYQPDLEAVVEYTPHSVTEKGDEKPIEQKLDTSPSAETQPVDEYGAIHRIKEKKPNLSTSLPSNETPPTVKDDTNERIDEEMPNLIIPSLSEKSQLSSTSSSQQELGEVQKLVKDEIVLEVLMEEVFQMLENVIKRLDEIEEVVYKIFEVPHLIDLLYCKDPKTAYGKEEINSESIVQEETSIESIVQEMPTSHDQEVFGNISSIKGVVAEEIGYRKLSSDTSLQDESTIAGEQVDNRTDSAANSSSLPTLISFEQSKRYQNDGHFEQGKFNSSNQWTCAIELERGIIGGLFNEIVGEPEIKHAQFTEFMRRCCSNYKKEFSNAVLSDDDPSREEFEECTISKIVRGSSSNEVNFIRESDEEELEIVEDTATKEFLAGMSKPILKWPFLDYDEVMANAISINIQFEKISEHESEVEAVFDSFNKLAVLKCESNVTQLHASPSEEEIWLKCLKDEGAFQSLFSIGPEELFNSDAGEDDIRKTDILKVNAGKTFDDTMIEAIYYELEGIRNNMISNSVDERDTNMVFIMKLLEILKPRRSVYYKGIKNDYKTSRRELRALRQNNSMANKLHLGTEAEVVEFAQNSTLILKRANASLQLLIDFIKILRNKMKLGIDGKVKEDDFLILTFSDVSDKESSEFESDVDQVNDRDQTFAYDVLAVIAGVRTLLIERMNLAGLTEESIQMIQASCNELTALEYSTHSDLILGETLLDNIVLHENATEQLNQRKENDSERTLTSIGLTKLKKSYAKHMKNFARKIAKTKKVAEGIRDNFFGSTDGGQELGGETSTAAAIEFEE